MMQYRIDTNIEIRYSMGTHIVWVVSAVPCSEIGPLFGFSFF